MSTPNNDKIQSRLNAKIIHIQSMLETSIKMQAQIIAKLEDRDFKDVYKSAVEEITKNNMDNFASLSE